MLRFRVVTDMVIVGVCASSSPDSVGICDYPRGGVDYSRVPWSLEGISYGVVFVSGATLVGWIPEGGHGSCTSTVIGS